MKEIKQFVTGLHKIHRPRLSKTEQVILPTEDCPLPDHTDDMTRQEWVMLCHLVHSSLVKQ